MNLSQFINYIPNCLICGKPLTIYTYASCENISNFSKKSYARLELINDNNSLITKHKRFHIKMDIKNNVATLDNSISLNTNIFLYVNFHKKCKTCCFNIFGQTAVSDIKKSKCNYNVTMDNIELAEEEIYYTLPKSKTLHIVKTYKLNIFDKNCTDIFINSKLVSDNILWNFSDFNNFKQLNKRINTILTFC